MGPTVSSPSLRAMGPAAQGWTPTSTPSLEERLDDH